MRSFIVVVSSLVTLLSSSPSVGQLCLTNPTTINSNFNGTAIPAGRTIWFNSIVNVSGISTETTVSFNGASVTLDVGGTPVQFALPSAVITFSGSATSASTVFVNGRWQTTVPLAYGGNVFLTGAGVPVLQALPGGINPVTWTGQFSASQTGLTFQWKWAAAVYTTFTTDPNAVGVKPIDGSALNPYTNSHHAGTPENFTAAVVGGARGGGGSNFTGSYSGTASAQCAVCPTAATVTILGAGCGVSPVPTLTNTPLIQGSLVTVSITSAAPNAQGILFGSFPTAPPLPLGSGCFVFVDLALLVLQAPFTTDASGTFTVTVPFASEVNRCGFEFITQAAILAAGGPLGGVQITNGVLSVIGS